MPIYPSKIKLNCLLFQEVFQPYPRSHTLLLLAIPHPLSICHLSR